MGLWNKQTTNFVKGAAKISQDNYPEGMGKMLIVNAPMIFTGIYALIKGWIDEKTRKKISLEGKNFMKTMLDYIDEDQIPSFLGGTNDHNLTDDPGPWHEWDLIDSDQPGAVVGVRRKNDPYGEVFTPEDLMALENPIINGMGVMGTKGAVIINSDGVVEPNFNATKSSAYDEDKYTEIVKDD